MTPDEAREIIVDEIVADAIDMQQVEWEDFPLIGENTWGDIVQAVVDRRKEVRPTPERFRQAYRLLAERADHV